MSVAGRMRSHPRSGAGPHTLFHTAECIQITVNPKCQCQIPDSSTRSCHIRSTSAALQPLQQFKTDFKISLSIPEAYHELAISLRFVCRSRAAACRGMFRRLVSDFMLLRTVYLLVCRRISRFFLTSAFLNLETTDTKEDPEKHGGETSDRRKGNLPLRHRLISKK